MTLYHYTCDHGAAGIAARGLILPGVALTPVIEHSWPAAVIGRYVWATDLDHPYRDALGLTSHTLSCDRTAHRFRITAPGTFRRWVDVGRNHSRLAAMLADQPGSMPMHWWVSGAALAVADPIGAAA